MARGFFILAVLLLCASCDNRRRRNTSSQQNVYTEATRPKQCRDGGYLTVNRRHATTDPYAVARQGEPVTISARIPKSGPCIGNSGYNLYCNGTAVNDRNFVCQDGYITLHNFHAVQQQTCYQNYSYNTGYGQQYGQQYPYQQSYGNQNCLRQNRINLSPGAQIHILNEKSFSITAIFVPNFLAPQQMRASMTPCRLTTYSCPH